MAGDSESAEVSVGGVAGRYALALLQLADEHKALDPVAEDLRGLKALIAESDDLRDLLRSPLYSRAQQESALAAVMDKAEIGDLTRKFVLVVARNRRLFALSAMIESYLAELARRRGEITARVTSAQPLSKAQTSKLVESLKGSVGKNVKVETAVDADLLGGLVVRVGSRMVDASLKTKLMKLQQAMKGA
ncbi:MAG: F0F1 ATP synthase subunit delta [Rhodospirillales bacterium]